MMLFIPGSPAPQGSKRHIGGGRMIEASKRVRPWREVVRKAASAAVGSSPPMQGPVRVVLRFLLPRPKSHKDTSTPIGKRSGDLDKLVRAVFDALTDAEVWIDDSQVTSLVATKVYVPESQQGVGLDIRTDSHTIPF